MPLEGFESVLDGAIQHHHQGYARLAIGLPRTGYWITVITLMPFVAMCVMLVTLALGSLTMTQRL